MAPWCNRKGLARLASSLLAALPHRVGGPSVGDGAKYVTADCIPIERLTFRLALAGSHLAIALCLLPLVATESYAQSRDKVVRFPPPQDDRAPTFAPPTTPLKCRLHKLKPRLDYELRLFTGYWIEIPTKQLAGPENEWCFTLIVQPLSKEGLEPTRVDQRVPTAAIPPETKGSVEFSGSFAMGEGRYAVSWHMRDPSGRYCDVAWEVEGKLSRADRKVDVALEPGEVAPSGIYLFRREPALERDPAGPNLRIKVLLNLDSGSRRRATLRPWQIGPMLSTLRLLARHPATFQFSVVAYSLEDQSVLYRQPLANRVNFPALGRAIKSLSPGTVEAGHLGKRKESDFFGSLLYDEVQDDTRLDALVFLGHDPVVGKRVAAEFVRNLNKGGYPVFYLNVSRHPWRGVVGQAVRTLGGKSYNIRRPAELALALDKMLARILEQRTVRAREPGG